MADNTNFRLSPGDTAPCFTLMDDSGSPVSLRDYAGRTIIIYFYPRADTPGCSTQACDFRDHMSQLNTAGMTVIGISRDTPEVLAQFRQRYHLTFPLLSDPDTHVHRAYGAFGQKNNYGKITHGVIRSTFVIDDHGVISLARYNVKATGHVARLAKEIVTHPNT